MTDLGTLGGSDSYATSINDSGEVVGMVEVTTTATNFYDSHAFLFSHGGMTDLSLLDVVVAKGWDFFCR